MYNFRLSVNYISSEGGMVTLESIIEQCYQFFEAKLLCIPNKDTIGKLMQPLFSAVPCLLCENGKKCVAYKKVQLRPEAQDGVVLPNYCELKKMSYNVLKFDMPLMMVLDGHIQKCEISFDSGKVTLQIRNEPFHISYFLAYYLLNNMLMVSFTLTPLLKLAME